MVALLADDDIGAGRELVSDPIDAAYERAFAAIDANEHDTLLVAELDGEIVGTMQVTVLHHLVRHGATRAQLEGVRVASAHRGMHIGEQLARAAIEHARSCGASIVQLTTDKRRTDAHRFYERLGFTATHDGMKLEL